MSAATDRLQLYLDAEAAVLKRQSVKFDEAGVTRHLTFANLAEIRAGIIECQKAVIAEQKANLPGGRGLMNCWYADFS